MKMASKRDSSQLPLFLRPTPPPFSLAPSLAEIRLRSGCGKQIITRRRTADGEIVCEYCDQAGRGFGCVHARPWGHPRASRPGQLPVKVTFDEGQKLLTPQIVALNSPQRNAITTTLSRRLNGRRGRMSTESTLGSTYGTPWGETT
jgi:hypothetical protein